jgi:hypothetical protein
MMRIFSWRARVCSRSAWFSERATSGRCPIAASTGAASTRQISARSLEVIASAGYVPRSSTAESPIDSRGPKRPTIASPASGVGRTIFTRPEQISVKLVAASPACHTASPRPSVTRTAPSADALKSPGSSAPNRREPRRMRSTFA